MGMPWAGSKYLGFRAVWLTWLCSCQTLFDNIGVSLWPQAKVCKPLSWAGGHVTPASWVGWEPLVSPPSPDRSKGEKEKLNKTCIKGGMSQILTPWPLYRQLEVLGRTGGGVGWRLSGRRAVHILIPGPVTMLHHTAKGTLQVGLSYGSWDGEIVPDYWDYWVGSM